MLLAAFGLHQLGGFLERRIEARIGAEAARLGAVARVERVTVALWPPVRIAGLVIEKPRTWRVQVAQLSARPALDRIGLRPVVHLDVGPTTVSGPGGLELRLHAASWIWDGKAVELADRSHGSRLRAVFADAGRRVDVEATRLDVERLVELRLEQAPVQPGPVDGELHWERATGQTQRARWRVAAIGAECKGEATLALAPSPGRVEIAVDVKALDFARLLTALGVERPFGAASLGSLAAAVTATGPLDAPATIAVTQRLDFAPPAALPSELLRLRGDFVHEAITPAGERVPIDVSPAAPDFVPRAELPPLFVRALLLAEDAAFFSHGGLDLTELPTALASNWTGGGALRGASTLSQQLAKNLFLSREKSLKRKLQELPLAFLLESALGKDRILEIYANVIEWGPGVYGLRPAARYYFGKEPGALSAKETAFLVVMIPGPVKYQRSFNEGALSERLQPLVDNLLAKLRSVEALSAEEHEAALAETLVFRRPDCALTAAPPCP